MRGQVKQLTDMLDKFKKKANDSSSKIKVCENQIT